MFHTSRALVCAISFVTVLFASSAHADVPITDDVILDWNFLVCEANKHDCDFVPPDQGGPTRTSRAFAIVHIAMYDAFNSVKGIGQPYLLSVPGASAASEKAAVAVAAHLTLKAMYPSQAAILDQQLAEYLAAIPDGPRKALGLAVGKIVGNAVLLSRSTDEKRIAEKVKYHPNDLPGTHRPDPLNPNQGFLTCGWGLVHPFAIGNVDDFEIPPPPALTTRDYAEAFDEVKSIGDKNSLTRTADQTEIGIFWGYDARPGVGSPPRLYNQCVRTIVALKHNTPEQNARLFALVNIAMADSGIAAWDDKYMYNFWRPVLAIREADPGTGPTGLGDGNPHTVGDPSWEPLGAPYSNGMGNNFSPPFPAYASGHATFGSATFVMLQLFYGTDDLAFTLSSDEYNGITTDNTGAVRPIRTRSYTKLSQALKENADSRIYLGVHWRFDATQGVNQGTAIAQKVFSRILKPTRNNSNSQVARTR
ncbi:phosphatase PAP2 family protein [bacterium]|nr:phosphatase PAP2 family protein [bacterium]